MARRQLVRLAIYLWLYCALIAILGIGCSEAWAFHININMDY